MPASPLDNSDGPLTISVKADGSEVPDDLAIQAMYITHELNRIPEATVIVQSDSVEIDEFEELDNSLFGLGAEIEIRAGFGDSGYQQLFKGIVTSQRARLDAQQGARLEVLCRDKALKLTETRSSARYEDMNDGDVMKAIITDAGLKSAVEKVKTGAGTQLRIGATDWDFLRLLADRNGFVVSVKEGEIKVAKPDSSVAPALLVTFGMDIIDFDISLETNRTIKNAVQDAWDEASQERVTGPSNYKPKLSFGDTKYSDFAENLGDRTHKVSTSREVDASDLKEMANARVIRSELAAVSGSISFPGCGEISPLDVLEISNTGKRFGGKGLVTAVSHMIEAGKWTSQTRLGLPPDWTSDSFGLAAPAAEAITTPIHGLQIGKVVQLADDPLGKQRILISLPMIGPEGSDVWARYAQPYASDGAGIQFLPEVGDEVIVAFLNADPNAPIIVGSLHNEKAKRPETETEENHIKTIVTREKLKVIFDEEKKIITVETPGGHKLVMDDDESSFSMQDMNGNFIKMDSSGIALKSDKDITLTATGKIEAKATMDATLSGQNVTCEGQIGFTGSGGATAEVSAGGQTKIEGGMVMIN
ncbi:type VI secretion system tip protein VgrG [Roseobacter denitrificans]|uniref:Gp5/Type VI secretion system Vgr protein OB-fold domain-containing protein n=1 Tax=Roseobacter denitrificans (strain ATCC 33942 / OCh 114) TaxID=375451 RepID=Q160D4_ROSDO|nr:type VI secretion system tip protein VgrG [Roseobacter denitrificans]ABG33659.1 conserved hypothetical protein [Roseobacter denitrificans OCh 114]AVL52949.1 type VI secretion system tip protein VgrG [Roseobacter denitrificans]SFG03028.1 Rhs element Vgr protein [Roseobacter denitrificans OCh 114]